MGGGGDSSSSQKTETHVTTNTTTNIRDIGLTGQNAVDIAAMLESGIEKNSVISSDVLSKLIQVTGEGFNQIVGGANKLIETAREDSEKSRSEATTLLTTAANEAAQTRSTAASQADKFLSVAAPQAANYDKFMKLSFISLGVAALLLLPKKIGA